MKATANTAGIKKQEQQVASAPIALLSPVPNKETSESEEVHIRALAFRLYEERGRIDGHDIEDWLEAESIIRGRGNLAA